MNYGWNKQKAIEKAAEYGIPDYMVDGLVRWVLHGPNGYTGDFLTAVICNDLKEACRRADDTNIHLLSKYVIWFYNWAPGTCWGSPKSFKTWKGTQA